MSEQRINELDILIKNAKREYETLTNEQNDLLAKKLLNDSGISIGDVVENRDGKGFIVSGSNRHFIEGNLILKNGTLSKIKHNIYGLKEQAKSNTKPPSEVSE